MALLSIGPELNRSRFITDVLADTNDIIEEMLRVKVWVLFEWNLCRLNALDAVKRQIKKLQVVLLGAKEEPTVAEFLQELRTKYKLRRFPCIE